MIKLSDFVDVIVDSTDKKYDEDKYESEQEAIEDCCDKIRDFVKKNYNANCEFGEYDPDYDDYSQVIHDMLSTIKGYQLIDFMSFDLFGVEFYALVLKQGGQNG